MKVVTHFIYPPIPFRGCDWQATIDSYDGDENAPRGFGPTQAEAVADLLDQLDNEADIKLVRQWTADNAEAR